MQNSGAAVTLALLTTNLGARFQNKQAVLAGRSLIARAIALDTRRAHLCF
jgi:hypothetical protein